ncbi:MAG: helix-turn-helix transcriptional regulator [Bacteroidaceae bacterium]|nr:helix-turn-helix transcriptional regulator [Bacteroidaceae bacterium]
MKHAIKERIIEFINHKGISKNAFENACNMSKRYLSNLKGTPGARIIKNIHDAFPELNTIWLITGTGEMLSENVENQKSTILDESRAPILPTTIAGRPDTDILKYVQNNYDNLELSHVIVLDTPIDMWHIIRDDAMFPTFKVGDKIALLAYKKGEESPIPGKIYAIDTTSNGLIIRKLIPEENGAYIARSLNEERYPDFIIKEAEIIRIFRIVYLGRSIV